MSGTLLLLVLAGCARVETTFVNGSVNQMSLPDPDAISTQDKDLLGFSRDTVLIGNHSGVCSRLVFVGLGVPSGIGSEAAREPALILQQGNALFDTGNGTERLRASKSTFEITERDNTGVRGHFSATFGTDTVSGDFVAPACRNLSAGCSSTPGLLLLGVLVWLRRSRRLHGAGGLNSSSTASRSSRGSEANTAPVARSTSSAR
jgi:hypothetical protein